MANVQILTQVPQPQHLSQQEYWPLHWRLSKLPTDYILTYVQNSIRHLYHD